MFGEVAKFLEICVVIIFFKNFQVLVTARKLYC